jgi:GTP cyclohydrolase II
MRHSVRRESAGQVPGRRDVTQLIALPIDFDRALKLIRSTSTMPEQRFVEHTLRHQDGADFRVRVLDYFPLTGTPPVAAIYGEPVDGCLVRVHSRCVYSEAFGATNCDCHAQLQHAHETIAAERTGVIVYLDQEGRGAGLFAKARSYQFGQAHQADTFASYRALNLPDDSRSYGAAADLLKSLGLTSVRLLTNNPDKSKALEAHGIAVNRKASIVSVSATAHANLDPKRRHGHRIPTPNDH